jgi:hypothetical protein
MVCTRSTEEHVLDTPEPSASWGQAPPPPAPHLLVSLKQLLATQNELMRTLVENDTHRGAGPHSIPATRI